MFVRGEQYDAYIGRWSRRIAPGFIDWLEVPAGARWLDLGCGTGALTETLLTRADPASVIGIDPSEGFVEHARERISDVRVSFEAGDAQSLPEDLSALDAVACALVLNFIPDPAKAVREISRVLRSGGIAGAYVWDYADGMKINRYFWDAATPLDPGAAALDEGRKVSICNPEGLAGLFVPVFDRVEVTSFSAPAVFESFDAYWQPFLGATGVAPAYLARLDDARRESLRRALEATLPRSANGSIHMSVRAWAVKGRKP